MKKKEKETILIQPIALKTVEFTIRQRENSPLVMHAWSQKALNQMRMTAAERKKQPKVARDPEEEAKGATYYTEDGKVGVNAMSIKSSLVGAAHKDYGIPRSTVMKALFLRVPDASGNIPLEYEEMVIREDCVRVGMSQTDLRYRPEFRGWRARICFEIDTRVLNTQDLINLANNAGFGIGIGEWRPEKGGEWGRFEVDTNEKINEQ
jgi:hypothetical protein